MGRADREIYRRMLRECLSDPMAERLNGTAACLSCTRVVSVGLLLDGYCPACHRPLRVAVVVDEVEPVHEAGVVYVDASWGDGVAGLAVVGAMGEHSRPLLCRSSVAAEVEALRWAMQMARALDERVLVFRTDSESARRFGVAAVRRGYDWTVEWVPRRRNRRADQLSRRARLNEDLSI